MPKSIGNKEEELFVSMHDLVFIDYEFINKYIYVHEDSISYHKNTIMNSLRALEKEGYIKSFPVAKANVRGADRLVYTLDTKGIQEAKEILGDVDWDVRWTQRTPTYIYHALRMANILTVYRKAESPNTISFLENFSERRAFRNYGEATKTSNGRVVKPSNTVIRPDGAFILKKSINGKEFHFLYFVEMERSRQRIEVTLEKLFRYNQYVLKQAYLNDVKFGVQIDMVRVLFVTEKENERDRLLLNVKKADTLAIEKINGAVMVATYEDVINAPYEKVWKSKNSKDQDICYSLIDQIK